MSDLTNEEKEIYSCHTALTIPDDFFCAQQNVSAHDLLPSLLQLINLCDGKIKSAGTYAIQLRLVKLNE